MNEHDPDFLNHDHTSTFTRHGRLWKLTFHKLGPMDDHTVAVLASIPAVRQKVLALEREIAVGKPIVQAPFTADTGTQGGQAGQGQAGQGGATDPAALLKQQMGQ